MIERALILSNGETLVFDEKFLRLDGIRGAIASGESLMDVERAHLVKVLTDCGWRISGRGNAAERLGLNRSTLRYRMARLGIERPATV